MRMNITSHDRRSAKDDLADIMAQTLSLLKKRYASGEAALVAALVDRLAVNTPVLFLSESTPKQLAQWVATLFDFLSGRTADVAVRLHPLTDRGGSLLLTNCADVPFLVHSIQLCLNRRHVHFRVVSHPIFRVVRENGRILQINSMDGDGDPESLVVIELEKTPESLLAGVEDELTELLRDVLTVETSRPEIDLRLANLSKCEQCSPYADFFNWLREDNVNLFAYRCLRIDPVSNGDRVVRPEKGETLGLAEKLFLNYSPRARKISSFDPRFQQLLLREERVGIEVLDRVSPILRGDRLTYIGAREELPDGTWLEHGFIGLQSDSAMTQQTLNVPVLRTKIEEAIAVLGIPRGSHDYRKVIEILNSYPKIELFFMGQNEIVETVRSLSLLYRHGMVRVIPARGLAIRGVTLLLVLPKNFYSDENLERISGFLCRYFHVRHVQTRITHISNDYMFVHANLQPQGDEVNVDIDKLERGLTQIALPWGQKLHNLLERTFGEEQGGRLWETYRRAFTADYQALVHPRFAVRDIRNIEAVLKSGSEMFDLWGPFRVPEQHFRLQFYSTAEAYLNDLMPFLENLNLSVIEEVDFTVETDNGTVFIKSFSICNRSAAALSLSDVRLNLIETLTALRSGAVENDYLHNLLVLTGLTWREIDIFRGYRNYYFQLGSPFTKKRVAFAFVNNPDVATLLFRYFEARFSPRAEWRTMDDREEKGLMPIRLELVSALENVADINEDQILRAFFNLIDSTIRTNYFVRTDNDDYFFSFKISAIGIIDMPAPRPLYEIYVHSNTMEGIHLRGGKVARGGIRWSDRPDDFRTEILGLMKTQMTKNTLIVPVGSKGGFVVKTPFRTREEGGRLSAEAYKTLMRGLLDLTDNRVDGKVVRPEGVVAYDDPDPYLVVAADKGTAHLPDTANAVAREYRFWLDDAFASGGSQGYDHKKLGITARGAWESVKRHFREMGTDVQKDTFTAIAIGDMSGDVFGNGMLQSERTLLRAAFNHQHIFIDPDPDPDRSYQERKRLFDLPRSTWDDYDRKVISAGGGIWERASKNIPLSEPLKQWLGIRHDTLDGQTLIRFLIAAETDLLWNGGIGTYVKSSQEKNEDVGDRANDNVRIDALQLKAKVVGEGGNLGLTQLARIEYALAGGRINTDAVDNSGGVDCSDHEVNLKILMGHLMNAGRVSTVEQRDAILLSVTDDVCDSVLHNNYTQSLALSLDLKRCGNDVEPFIGLLDRLVRAGLLDRRSEFLPSAREIYSRSGKRLVKPELAILIAYSKMHLYQALQESDLYALPVAHDFLRAYFPERIRGDFEDELPHHPLAREIVSTVMTNRIVDQAGSSFVLHVMERTGATAVDVARAYLLFDLAIGGAELRAAIYDLDNRMPADQQHELLLSLEDCLSNLVSEYLATGGKADLQREQIATLRDKFTRYAGELPGLIRDDRWQAVHVLQERLAAVGVGEETARFFAQTEAFFDFLPVNRLVEETGKDLFTVFRTYLDVRSFLQLDRLHESMQGLVVRDHWDRMARTSVIERFHEAHFRLTLAVCTSSDCNIDRFFTRHRSVIQRWRRLYQDALSDKPVNLNPFTVLAETLDEIPV